MQALTPDTSPLTPHLAEALSYSPTGKTHNNQPVAP
jgi:hypothetical protein